MEILRTIAKIVSPLCAGTYMNEIDSLFVIICSLLSGVAFFLNTLLLFLIICHSPKSLTPYRVFLANTTLTQLLSSVCTLLNQPRVITLHSTTVVIYLGPIQFLGKWMSYMSYICLLHLSLNSFISLMLSMVYRYYSIKYYRFSFKTSVIVCIAGYIIPFILLMSCTNIEVDGRYETNKELLKDMVPNLQDYSMALSTDTKTQPQVLVLIFFVTVGLVPIYCIMYWCRYQIYRKLEKTSSVHSMTTKDNARRLVKALTIQSVIPLVSVFPASIFFCLSQASLVDPLLYSYLIVPCLTIGCIADPLVTIHSVLPYRRCILRLCNLQSGEITASNQERTKSDYQPITKSGSKKLFMVSH